MAKNPNTNANKRRVQSGRVASPTPESAPASSPRRDRRKLWVTLVIAFLAFALIAPLTAGLIAGDDEPEIEIPEPVELAWVPEQFAGAELSGDTPCPATDGSAERTTSFAVAPELCIDDTETFSLVLDTGAGELAVPIDASLNHTGANLASVFGHYQTYENTLATTSASGGLVFVGGPAPAGFELPLPTETQGPYEVGSVVLIGSDTGLSGALAIVLDDQGVAELDLTGRHVVIGQIDDLESINSVVNSDAFAGGVVVADTSVS